MNLPVSILRDRLAAAPAAARERLLVEFLVRRLRSELGMEDDDPLVHPRSRFEDLGIDSKRALELKEMLEMELGCALRTTLLFDYPTPESLAGHLVEVAFGFAAPRSHAPAGRRIEPAAVEPVDSESPDERLRRKLSAYDE
jgi:acyl carrier protein